LKANQKKEKTMTTLVHTPFIPEAAAPLVQRAWWAYLLWIPAAALLGFAVSWIFADLLRLPRSLFLVPYVLVAGLVVYTFFRWSGLSLSALLRHHWAWGLAGALVFGAFVVRNVLSQPASPHSAGLRLAIDLLWSGVVYGGMDALLLSVLPVLATWGAFAALGWTGSWPGKIAAGGVAFFASLFVTVCYHLGFPEYRAAGGIAGPSIGNGVMTLGYLLTNNPITAVFSHMAMHVAGVLHGPASVVQLPPH
jgi:hypothetical protein